MLTGTWLEDWGSTTTATTSTRCSSFFSAFQSTFKSGILEINPSSLWQNNWLVVKFKSFGCSSGAGVTLLLRFPFPGLWGDIAALLQGWSRAGTYSDRLSTRPTSATSDIRTPARQDDSPTSDDSTLRTSNHLSVVSRSSFRLTTTASYAFLRSTKVAS